MNMKKVRTCLWCLWVILPGMASGYDFTRSGFFFNVPDDWGGSVRLTHGEPFYQGKLTVPETVEDLYVTYEITEIEPFAFCYCKNLQEITLPSALAKIGSNAFWGCTSLKTVRMKAEVPPAISEDTFTEEIYAGSCLWVPEGSSDLYKSQKGWCKFRQILETEANSLAVPEQETALRVQDDLVYLEGLQMGDLVCVYSLKGLLVKQQHAVSSTVCLRLDTGAGYLIRTPQKVFKCRL